MWKIRLKRVKAESKATGHSLLKPVSPGLYVRDIPISERQVDEVFIASVLRNEQSESNRRLVEQTRQRLMAVASTYAEQVLEEELL